MPVIQALEKTETGVCPELTASHITEKMSFHFSKSSLSQSNKADRNGGKHLASYSVLHMCTYKHTYMYCSTCAPICT